MIFGNPREPPQMTGQKGISCEPLAAEQLRLMGFDNRLIIDR